MRAHAAELTAAGAIGLGSATRFAFVWPVHALLLFAGIGLSGISLVAYAVDTVYSAEPIVIAGFLLNAIIAAAGLSVATARDSLSITVIFWYYSFLFLAIAPLAQYLTGRWIYPLPANLIVQGNLLVLLSLCCFAATNGFGRSRRAIAAEQPRRDVRRLTDGRLFAMCVLALTLVLAIIAAGGGFSPWLSPVLRLFDGQFTPVSMLAEFMLRPLVFFIFLVAVLRWRRGTHTSGAAAALGTSTVAAMLMLGPLSASRFFIFAMYLGLLVILFPPSRGNRYFYIALLFVGILGSHLQNVLRDIVAERTDGVTGFSANYFYAGHFDGFENLCHAIAYVARDGIAWGEQFLSAVLFWVPREWWPEKPVGSATYITSTYLADYYAVGSVNVAAPLVQEAFLNFHVPGVVLVFTLVGYASGRADARFRRAYEALCRTDRCRFELPGRGIGYTVLYPVLVGLSLFILRGDLLSSFAFTTGIVTAFIAMRFAVRWLSRRVPVVAAAARGRAGSSVRQS